MTNSREPAESTSELLDAVLESAMRSLRAGHALDVEALATQHPVVANEIRELLPALIMAENLRSQSLRDGSSPSEPTLAHTPESDQPSANRPSSLDSASRDELLYAAMALQCELISPEQFLSAFSKWQKDSSQSLKQILIDRHPVVREIENLMNELLPDQEPAGVNDAHARTQVFTPGGSASGGSGSGTSASGRKDETAESSSVAAGRFQILRALDRGGLGIVSVALDRELNREVALKEIRSDRAHDRFLQQKFLLEAEVTGGLEHPGIVPIYGLGRSTDGHPYYAMRLIRGSNLQSHIQKFHQQVTHGKSTFDGQSLRKLLRRFIDVCEAIEYAHSRGVLHRDIKPVNVMLGRYGETLVVDWGLAKALGFSAGDSQEPEESSLIGNPSESPLLPSGSHDSETRDGSIVGTPAYAAPEQLFGKLSLVSVRSDVYGLGATLYELLTGQPPVRGTLTEVTQKVREGHIQPPRIVNPQVPKALDAICRKAMSLKPEERYASASQLRADVESWLDDAPVVAMPEPFWAHCRRWIRKHPTLAATLSVAVCMSILGISAFAFMVARNNASLARLNRELDASNGQLVLANEREKEARQSAQEQSQLALTTLNAVVNDVQTGLKLLPGGSNARRRLADTVMPRLEKVVQSSLNQTSPNRATLRSLMELSQVVLQMGTEATPTARGTVSMTRLTKASDQSAARLARSTLERALAIAQQLMDSSPSSAEARMDLVDCCLDLGNISAKLGQQEAAVGYFESAVKNCEQLVAAHPQEMQYQLKLATMRLHLGDCIVRSKRVEEAVKLYEPAIASLRNLVAASPSGTLEMRALSIGLQFMGDAQEMQDKALEAQQSFEEAVQLRRRIIQADGRPQYIRELVYALGKLASNYQSRSEIQQAIQSTEENIQLLSAAIALDPVDTWFQSELASNKELQAKLLRRSGNSAAALARFHEVVSIRNALCNRDSSDINWKRNLSVAYDNLGKFLSDQGDLNEALEPLTQSLQIARELAEMDATSANNQRDIALSLVSIGKLRLKESKPADALPLFQESLDIMTKVAQADPNNAMKQRDRLIGISYIADCHMALDRPNQALPLYQEGLDLARQSVRERPQANELKRDLGIWLSLVMDVQLRLGNPAAAVQPALEAVELNRAFMAIDDKDVRAKIDYAQSLSDAGSTLSQVARMEEAEKMLQDSVALLGQLFEQDLNNSDLKEKLAAARQKLGDLHLTRQQLDQSVSEYLQSQTLLDQLVRDKPNNVLWRKNWVEVSMRLADAYSQQALLDKAQTVRQTILAFLDDMIAKDQDADWARKQHETIQSTLAK